MGALLLFAFGALAGALGAVRPRPRSLVALGTACALFSFTTAGCGHGGEQPPAAAAIYYHGDHLGGVALQTDASGAVAAEVAYDPYGAQLAGSTEPYSFTGKEYDADTGLYDFGARAYDPALGRFLSPDPTTLADPELGVADPQLLNPYSYARNAPTGHVDPEGKLPHILVGALAGAAIGGGIYLAKAAITGGFSWRGLGGAVAGGAVAGAVAAATCGASLVVQGAAAGLAGGIAQRGVETASLSKTFDPKAMAVDTALGAAAGPALKLAGKGLSAVGQRIAPLAKRVIALAKPPSPGRAAWGADPYAGIKAASTYLQRMGVSRAERVQILQSFEEGTVRLRQAGASEYGLRFFDNVNAFPRGRYLFETFPVSRSSLALKSQWNQMTGIAQWRIPAGTTLIEGRAAAQGLGLAGGSIQKFVLNSSSLVPP
jgi:RHS repeat-associated protein